jgi:hypothetical protein
MHAALLQNDETHSLWRWRSSGCHGGSEKPALPHRHYGCAQSRKAECLGGDGRAEGRVVCATFRSAHATAGSTGVRPI